MQASIINQQGLGANVDVEINKTAILIEGHMKIDRRRILMCRIWVIICTALGLGLLVDFVLLCPLFRYVLVLRAFSRTTILVVKVGLFFGVASFAIFLVISDPAVVCPIGCFLILIGIPLFFHDWCIFIVTLVAFFVGRSFPVRSLRYS